ncbi:formate dehydrogenase accessory sulfurtransferase FdhD [Salipaludibacillus aurantiacus]|uniref:Sulfur carrier protein FdhD n=1 Tax=Salipaludibacillus aurantiacus TaxID=1601833 RepID=A0A1H9X1S6_9BACI|nr:formate dehydrogenase accessory sulfurtransferase FdhD [Salipaludibacillus aurantiacus]SES40090.1 FdhD protein [Salipaludibacillus aurantiacus]
MIRREELSKYNKEAHNIMKKRPIISYEKNQFSEKEDVIAAESPLTILVNGEEFATLLCTPSYVEELAVGFLASEGMIRTMDDIKSLSVIEEKGFVYVQLYHTNQLNEKAVSKRYIGSCCGKSRQFYFQNDVKTAKTVVSRTTVTASQCFNLMETMQAASTDFQQTGGLHNVALCLPEELVLTRSDIGRHNGLDKIYGHCLKHRLSLKNKLIVFSGRLSSEVLLKVSKIGVGIVLSKSAPTTLAIELADDLGITTAGFIRNGRFNVYTHPERITS